MRSKHGTSLSYCINFYAQTTHLSSQTAERYVLEDLCNKTVVPGFVQHLLGQAAPPAQGKQTNTTQAITPCLKNDSINTVPVNCLLSTRAVTRYFMEQFICHLLSLSRKPEHIQVQSALPCRSQCKSILL